MKRARIPGINDMMVLDARARRYLRKSDREKNRTLASLFGIKRWFISESAGMLSAYAGKEKRRRRAAQKVAHESRRRNRA